MNDLYKVAIEDLNIGKGSPVYVLILSFLDGTKQVYPTHWFNKESVLFRDTVAEKELGEGVSDNEV